MSVTTAQPVAGALAGSRLDTIEPRRRAWRPNSYLRFWAGATLVFVFAGIAAPWISGYPYDQQNLRMQFQPPVWAGGTSDYPLGTDQFGRDMLSRLIYGARVSLVVAFFSVVLAGLVGISLGMVSGYLGGKVDSFIMRVADIQYSFPYILLAIVIAAFWGPGQVTLIVSLAFAGWATFARAARGSTLAVKEREYVSAARALGAGDFRIIFQHVLPNIMAPLLVFTTFQVPSRILAEATLSFIGLGIQPPQPSWGNMLAENRGFLVSQPWLVILPGVAVMLLTISVNQLGDGLRDALDPRLTRRLD
jgi:peptide/nickel transport system permease protein